MGLLTGGCLCGEIRFKILGDPEFVTNCHCAICRKASGAPYMTWMVVKPDHFVLTCGSLKYYKSSQNGNRGFCENCGSSLTFCFDNLSDEMDVSAAVLDDPERVEPVDHIWVKSKLHWVKPGDGLAQLETDHLHEGYPE